ncbi:MAG: hypothetical protein AAF570_28620, partial [Bacteroidota bacterium]
KLTGGGAGRRNRHELKVFNEDGRLFKMGRDGGRRFRKSGTCRRRKTGSMKRRRAQCSLLIVQRKVCVEQYTTACKVLRIANLNVCQRF